jgi:hypothetical protein
MHPAMMHPRQQMPPPPPPPLQHPHQNQAPNNPPQTNSRAAKVAGGPSSESQMTKSKENVTEDAKPEPKA